MADATSFRNLFNTPHDNENGDNVSLTNSVMSAYNSLDSNMKDINNIINSIPNTTGGKKTTKRRTVTQPPSQTSCLLYTVNEHDDQGDIDNKVSILPSDSVSNISSITPSKSRLNDNVRLTEFDNIDETIDKFNSVIQDSNIINGNRPPSSLNEKMHIRPIVETNSKSIFDNKEIIQPAPQPFKFNADKTEQSMYNVDERGGLSEYIGSAETKKKWPVITLIAISFIVIVVSYQYIYPNVSTVVKYALIFTSAILFGVFSYKVRKWYGKPADVNG